MPDPPTDSGPGPTGERIEELYTRARTIPDADERARFVREACEGDVALESELTELLAEDGEGYLGRLADRVGIPDPGSDLPELDLSGRVVGAYRLVEVMGRGGMGAVYLAERADGSGSAVALKLLPIGVATDVARRRFVAEQATLARLDHPGIARLLDGGVTDDGTPYFVMELVEGRSIHEACHGTTIEARLGLFCEALDGVQAAHDAGVVHRDLKPEHILVTPAGRVKLLDFGVAKVLDEQGGASTTLTRIGGPLLTPRYASPEQLLGQAVSPASDVYSLGVILYRLLTGEEPFDLRMMDLDEVIRTVVGVDPVPPSRRVAAGSADRARHLTGDLDAIVLQTLRKEPGRRYASAGDLRDDLRRHLDNRPIRARPPTVAYRARRLARRYARRLGAAAVLVGAAALGSWLALDRAGTPLPNPDPSVAVLPLEDATGRPELTHIAPGLTDEVVGTMLATRLIRVPAPTSTLEALLSSTTPADVGARLSASTVLTGTVSGSADSLSVSVRLTDAGTGAVLWEEAYPSTRASISRIAGAVTADVLHVLGLPESAAAVRRGTTNEAAYDLYLRGRYLWNHRSDSDLRAAIDHFRRAIDLDPGFALAYVGMANAYSVRTDVPAEDAMPVAKAAARRALDIDETVAPAHIALARLLQVYEWNAAEAESHYLRALALEPSLATAHHWYGLLFLTFGGHFDEAARHLGTARELDPLSAPIATAVGMPMYYEGRYEAVVRHWLRVAELHPDYDGLHIHVGDAYRELGRYGDAVEHYLSAFRGQGRTSLADATARGWAEAGWEGFIDAWRAFEMARDNASPYVVAQLHGAAGDDEGAMAWLQRAVAVRDWELIRAPVDPLFRRLHGDPRFEEVLAAVGAPW